MICCTATGSQKTNSDRAGDRECRPPCTRRCSLAAAPRSVTTSPTKPAITHDGDDEHVSDVCLYEERADSRADGKRPPIAARDRPRDEQQQQERQQRHVRVPRVTLELRAQRAHEEQHEHRGDAAGAATRRVAARDQRDAQHRAAVDAERGEREAPRRASGEPIRQRRAGSRARDPGGTNRSRENGPEQQPVAGRRRGRDSRSCPGRRTGGTRIRHAGREP